MKAYVITAIEQRENVEGLLFHRFTREKKKVKKYLDTLKKSAYSEIKVKKIKVKKAYEIEVEVEAVYECDYDSNKKKSIDKLVPFLDEDGEEKFMPWFYYQLDSKKKAMNLFKTLVLSSTASKIKITLKEDLYENKTKIIKDSKELYSIYMSNEKNYKQIKKELKKIK